MPDDRPEGLDEKRWLIFSHKWAGKDGYASWYATDARGYIVSSLAAGRFTEGEAKSHKCDTVTEAVEIGSDRFRALLKKWAWWELETWDELAAIAALRAELAAAERRIKALEALIQKGAKPCDRCGGRLVFDGPGMRFARACCDPKARAALKGGDDAR